jgi:hypothetical protein
MLSRPANACLRSSSFDEREKKRGERERVYLERDNCACSALRVSLRLSIWIGLVCLLVNVREHLRAPTPAVHGWPSAVRTEHHRLECTENGLRPAAIHIISLPHLAYKCPTINGTRTRLAGTFGTR